MIFRRAFACLLSVLALWRLSGAEPTPVASPVVVAPATPPVPLVPTVIESGSADMTSTEKETTFTFRHQVTVTGTNMKITCDELVVIARRAGDPAATLGKQENFKSLIATGNVRILQNDREATCGRAAVYPGEDKVELTESPMVRSIKEGWTQTGPKMVLYRGQRRAVIEGTATERPKLVLPPLKDLGYEKEKAKEAAKQKEAEKKAADPDALPPVTVPLPPQPK
jgi:lipopolysaccharide export system protein LptA